MALHRPGDLLAGRYRLDDLLSETGQARFWLGHDQVLSRAVAIHVLDADDERAPLLIAAARASAQVVEPRLLRVLDVESDAGISYVVNEWGTGTSLDHLVAAEGPLPPRRAAWVVAEVAAALQNAHAHGVAHGRLNPENVLVDTTGSVRLISFAVEAALHGLGPDRIGVDVVDLAGLLHFALTGRWAGLSDSAVPPAPREQHGGESRVLRPRQVRAGIPRVLDDLCDEVLNRPHGRHAGPNTAREIHEALAAFVGDPNGLAEELADRTIVVRRALLPPVPDPLPFDSLPAVPVSTGTVSTGTVTTETGTTDTATTDRVTDDAAASEAASSDTGSDTGDGPRTAERPDAAGDVPTQAGTPVFESSGSRSSWFTPRDDLPAPPPPLEPPPERPLFAPEPEDGTPARRSRYVEPPPPPVTDSSSYWPFDATPETDPVPGRRWLRFGLALTLLVVLIVAAAVAFHVGRNRDDPGARGGSGGPTTGTTSAAAPRPARPVRGVRALDFDPQGDPPTENRDLAPDAVDGDPATSWRTSTYKEDLGPRGLKRGVGLILDLRRTYRVDQVDLGFARAGTAVSVFVSATPPTSADRLGTPAASTTGLTGTTTVRLDKPATGRYVTLWFTSLPRVSDGYRAEVSEVSVVGAAG